MSYVTIVPDLVVIFVLPWLMLRCAMPAIVLVKHLRKDHAERQRYEDAWTAWRFAQPPLKLSPEEIAAGWQVKRFRNGVQCKVLSDDVIMRKLCGPAPFVPPKESYVFEDGLAKLRSLLPKPTQSPFEFAEDLAARRKALEDYKF